MPRFLPACLALAALAAPAGWADDKKPVKTTLVLRFTFAGVKDGQVPDVSGAKLAGKLVKGKVVKEDGEMALELEGEGQLTVAAAPRLDPTDRPLVIGAWCRPDTSRGVVAALGGETHGFSLYLKEGVPTFAVRVDGKLTLARAENRVPAGRWAHLMGVLDADGRAHVWVDGRPSGDAVNTGLLTKRPEGGLSVGADADSLVGDYKDEQHWTGRLKDVRLYWGALGEAEVRKWAKLPE